MSPKFSLYLALNFLLFAGISFLAKGQTGPGGVGNSASNKIWLKADEGIINSTPNSRVGVWADQSGNGFNANQISVNGRPSYQLNGLNGLPFIHFDRTAAVQYLELTSSGLNTLVSNSNTIFVVGKVNSGGADNTTNAYQSFVMIPGYHSGIGVSGYPETLSVYMTNWLGASIPGKPTQGLSCSAPLAQGTWQFFTRTMTENSNGTGLRGFVNGSLINATSSSMQMTNYNPNLIRIGAAFTSGTYTWALNGDISEIIIYNEALNEAERILVDNYLSSKYNQAISNDKYSFDGGNEFPHQVAGIGRQDAINIHASANSGSININSPSSLEDGEYVLLGHNGQPLVLTNSDAPTGINRLDRVWRVDLTGDPGTVSMSFDVHNFSLSPGHSFRLLVDNDGQFTNATTYMGTVSNGVFTVNNPVSLTDGDYITISYNQTGPSAPVAISYEPNQNILNYGSPLTSVQPALGDGGVPSSFSLINPPVGVTINSTTGEILVNHTMTYTPVGTYSVTVAASNSYGTSIFTDVYTITIQPYETPDLIYPSRTVSLGNAIEPISPNLLPNAFDYTLVSGSLGGLTLNSSSGVISGILQSEGTQSVVIRATARNSNAIGSPVTTTVNFTAIGATGPSGIGSPSSNKIWLDVNHLTGLTNGSRVSTFLDRSGNGWNAVQTTASNRPTYVTNQLNGLPVIRFDRSSAIQYLDLTASGIGASMSNSNTMFVVAKANSGSASSSTPLLQSLITVPGYHSSICFSGNPSTTDAYMISYLGGTWPGSTPSSSISSSATLTQGTWQLLSRRISENLTTLQTGFINGAVMGNSASSNLPMTNYTANLLRIGAASLSGAFSWPLNGDIAEIIFFNTVLNEAQQIIIENYLSAKYGLYILNDKYTMHDATYIQDVEGIGTTDGNNSTKHSIASNSKGLKIMELNASLNTGGEFLLAGHASSINAWVNIDLPISVQQRWQRAWYLEKTGAIDAKLSFDISDAGLTVPVNLSTEFNYYRLLYRASVTSPFTVVPVMPSLENSDQLVFALSNAQLLNGYYTIGYSQGIVWTGAQDHQWNTAANWSLNRIPDSNDQVVINTCITCPRLNSVVNVATVQLNTGSALNLDSYILTVGGATFLNETNVTSNQGKIQSADFAEVKNSVFKGIITLEKTGGSENACYGGNTFSPELKIVNSSNSEWQISSQVSNVIQTP